MNDFLLGLQFLTRITVKKNLDWSEKSCGGSVKFFPFIGAVLGIIYVIAGYAIYFLLPRYNINPSVHLTGFILLALNIFLTGALHCDGFTDTMDGILSGRKRERILEIMKDSRVGAHGAATLILLLIGKFAMFTDLEDSFALTALFLMPVISRCCMSIAIVSFPYARKEGMGKAFHEYSRRKDMLTAGLFTCLVSVLSGIEAIAAFILTVLIMYCFNRYVSRILGGLTGDVYGATTELGEFTVLFIFITAQTFVL